MTKQQEKESSVNASKSCIMSGDHIHQNLERRVEAILAVLINGERVTS